MSHCYAGLAAVSIIKQEVWQTMSECDTSINSTLYSFSSKSLARTIIIYLFIHFNSGIIKEDLSSIFIDIIRNEKYDKNEFKTIP